MHLDGLNKETLLVGKVLDFLRSGTFFRPERLDLSILESGDLGTCPLIPNLCDIP
jgi:hypothetical protein